MERLTEKEIEEFVQIVTINKPIIEKVLKDKRAFVKFIREKEMTEENLAALEISTESMCKIYLVKKMWDEINVDELFAYPDDAICEYVRSVIRIFKKHGENYA